MSGSSSRPAGRFTILVSHRFSTVRMAYLIVVLEYSELYGIQAAAYR
jgi:ABC-type bacteriocin/lantibiotic exporter with double-glycine peptidase domain